MSKTEIKKAAAHARAMARKRVHNGTIEANFNTETGEVFFDEHLPNNWSEYSEEVVSICVYRCSEEGGCAFQVVNSWGTDLIDTIGTNDDVDEEPLAHKPTQPTQPARDMTQEWQKAISDWKDRMDALAYDTQRNKKIRGN